MRAPIEMNSSPPPSTPSERRDFARHVFWAGGIIALIVIGFFLLWYAVYVLLLIFAGILLAIFLRSLADGVTHVTRLPPGWSLAVVVLGLIGIFVAIGWVMAPRISQQATELANRLPEAVEHLADRVRRYQGGDELLRLLDRLNAVEPSAPAVIAQARGVVSRTLQILIAVVVTLFVGLYLAAQPRLYLNGMLRLLPRRHRPRGRKVLLDVGLTLRWWLIGQAIDMLIIAVATALGLWLLDIPLALVIGILAGLFNFIPNFGPLISLTPAVLLALMEGPQKALSVVMLYVVLQSLEGYVLLPLIQRRAVRLPPVLTIVAQILLAILAGPLGLLLATPLMAAALVLTQRLYVEDVLKDRLDRPVDDVAAGDTIKPDAEALSLPPPT